MFLEYIPRHKIARQKKKKEETRPLLWLLSVLSDCFLKNLECTPFYDILWFSRDGGDCSDICHRTQEVSVSYVP